MARTFFTYHWIVFILITPLASFGTFAGEVSTPAVDATWLAPHCSNMGTRNVWDPRDNDFVNVPTWTFDHFTCGVNVKYDPQPTLWRTHRTQLQSSGVSRATLAPKGVDLGALPEYKISDDLTLKPVLFYGPIFWPQNRLASFDAQPKFWQNHHGELIRYVHQPGLQYDRPLGETKGVGPDRDPFSFPLQTLFISDSGQQVVFYPSPDEAHTWFSEAGNLRLRDTHTADDASTFVIENGKGLTFTLEKYKVSRVEGLALHYRVNRIEDRYGNWLDIQFRASDSNEPSVVQAFQKIDGNASAMHKIEYIYETGTGRLERIRMPAYAGQTTLSATAVQDIKLYYADELPTFYSSYGTDFVKQVMEKVAVNPLVHVASGTSVVLSPLMDVDLYFHKDPLATSSSVFVDHTRNILSGNIQNLPWPQREMDLDFSGGIVQLEPTSLRRGYLLEMGAGILARTFHLAGSKFRYRMDASDYPTTSGFDSAQYPDRCDLSKLGGASGLPLNGAHRGKIYSAIKTGDLMIAANGSQAEVVWDAAMTPSSVPLSSTLNGPVYHLREDQRYRIALIVMNDPQEGGDQESQLLIRYGDSTVNHGEIVGTTQYHTAVLDNGEPKALLETTYKLQRISYLKGSGDFAGEAVAPGENSHFWRYCDMSTTWSIGQMTAPLPIKVGLTHDWENDMDILRRKTTRFLQDDGTYGSRVTYYGGAFRPAFSGDKAPFDVLGAAAIGPDEQDARDCHFVQWGLDAKPFDFTWEIRPDGSAMVYDLDPKGLGLDPLLAGEHRRRRTFKTYSFDTRFKDAVTANPNLSVMLDDDIPFFQFLPPYTSASGSFLPSTILADPGAPQVPVPSLKALFDLKDATPTQQTFAYKATFTAYTHVPKYGYSQEADIANSDQRYKRETLALIHGQGFDNGIGFDASAFRTSVLAILSDHANLGLEEALFKGTLKTSLTFEDPQWQSPKTETVHWSKGGRIDIGSFFQTYFDRVNTMRLLPQTQMEAVNHSGFSWDDTLGHMALDAKDIVAAQRLGQGGYLGSAEMASSLEGSTVISIQQTAPPLATLMPGDVVYMDHLIHSIKLVNGNQVTIEPGLREALDEGSVLKFYRYFNPIAEDATGRYRGYDPLGNISYSESYRGNQGLFWPTVWPGDSSLLPYFFDNNHPPQPRQVKWNDSTEGSNNDTLGWQYFGRNQLAFSGHVKPFWDYAAVDVSTPGSPTFAGGLNRGSVQSWQYDSAHQPWQVTKETSFYKPLVVNNWVQLETELAAFLNSDEHDEDGIAEHIYYHNASSTHFKLDSHTARYGMPFRLTSYKRGSPGSFHRTVTSYNNLGHLLQIQTVNSASGYEKVATRQTFDVDGNLDLVYKLTTHQGSVSNYSVVGLDTPILQHISVTDFDSNGRLVGERSYDSSGILTDEHLVGFASKIKITSPLEQITYALPGANEPVTHHFGKVIEYRNGLGEPTATVTQTGPAAESFQALQTYDSAGRPDRTYANAELSTVLGQRGYVQFAYNQRNERIGEIHYLKEDRDPVSSFWEDRTWDSANDRWQWLQLSQNQSQDPNTSGINRIQIKRQWLDLEDKPMDVGIYELAFDGMNPQAPSDWETLFDENDVGEIPKVVARLNDATLLSHAIYAWDRMGHISEATVFSPSNSATQLRKFQFDQKGRLRQETHPEFAANATALTYSEPDGFDRMTQSLAYVGPSQFRKTYFDYDPNGLLLTRKTYEDNLNTNGPADEAVTFTYRYQDPGLGQNRYLFADALLEESTAFDGQSVAYTYAWDQDSGLLLSKTMVPNLDGFNSQVSLNYSYDDDERLHQMIYPAAIAGRTESLKLQFEYADGTSQYGHLRRIRDMSETGTPLLVDDIHLGPAGYLGFDFGLGGTSLRGVDFNFDTLNRLTSLDHLYQNADGLARRQQRFRHYSLSGQLKSVASHEGSQASTGTLPHLRSMAFSYDSIGQLRHFALSQPSQPDRTIDFAIDPFGNLTSRTDSEDGTTTWNHNAFNQLSNSNYSHYGELTSGTVNGSTFQLTYSPHGRLLQHSLDNQVHKMTYDPAGLRVLTREPGSTSKLTFYDDAGMALAEWRKENGMWLWDKSFVSFLGQTILSFEHDPDPTAPLPTSGPDITSSTLLHHPVAAWEAVSGATQYDFQVADQDGVVLETLFDVPSTQARFNKKPPGPYQLRARPKQGSWGPWQDMVLAPAELAETLGYYPLDWDVEDLSVFQNHGNKDGPDPIDGLKVKGMAFDDDDSITLPDPFVASQNTSFSLAFWMKPEPVGGSESAAPRHVFRKEFLFLGIQPNGDFITFSKAGPGTSIASYTFPHSQWHQLVMTASGNAYTLFLNGVAIIQGNLQNGLPDGVLHFGKHGGVSSFLGILDEIHLWSRELSQQEVTDLYQGGTP